MTVGVAFASITAFLVGGAMTVGAAFASITAFANFIFAAITATTGTTITVFGTYAMTIVTTVITHAETENPASNYA